MNPLITLWSKVVTEKPEPEEQPFNPFEALSQLGVPSPTEVPAEEIFGPDHEDLQSDAVLPTPWNEPEPAPSVKSNPNPKDSVGSKKPALLSVIPPAGLLHLGSAMAEGARKYGAFNWRDNSVVAKIYVDAITRHLLQYLDGEDFDPESGCHHLGHVMASCAIVLDAKATGNLIDDRPKPGAAGDMIRGYNSEIKFNF